MTKNIDFIIDQYDCKSNTLINFKDEVHRIVTILLNNKKRGIHNISCRIKARDSLIEKISRPTKIYNTLDDITDIVGIRIITYFEDDVQKISEILSSELDIDKENSIDKRNALRDSEFGYRSVHLIAQFDKSRTQLPEYREFEGLKFEVQIRSILQHAWAEIEHDLGYKSSSVIPEAVRRKFYRMAGLLELADEEFISIREKRKDYIDSISLEIDKPNLSEDIKIDADSYRKLISKRDIFKVIRSRSESIGIKFSRNSPYIDNKLVLALEDVGFSNLRDLMVYTDSHRDSIIDLIFFIFDPIKKDIEDKSRSITMENTIFAYYTFLHSAITKDKQDAIFRFFGVHENSTGLDDIQDFIKQLQDCIARPAKI